MYVCECFLVYQKSYFEPILYGIHILSRQAHYTSINILKLSVVVLKKKKRKEKKPQHITDNGKKQLA